MERYNKIMQYVWLAVALLSSVFAAYKFFTMPEGEEPEYMIFALPFIAAILFFLRRRHNHVMSQNKEDNK